MPIEAKHTPTKYELASREKPRTTFQLWKKKKDIQHKQQNRIVVSYANCESVIRLKTFYMEPECEAHAIASFNTEIIQFIQFIQFLIQFAKAKLQQ